MLPTPTSKPPVRAKKLAKQKESMDYSRFLGGQKLLSKCVETAGSLIKRGFDNTLSGAGIGSATIAPIYMVLHCAAR